MMVSHVLSEDLTDFENDKVAAVELKKEFPTIEIAPTFKSPAEAKNFISSLYGFLGARMHATIAAYTTGIPVLPFSYSPKFEGLFDSLNYKHIVSGTIDNNNISFDKTKKFIENIEKIKTEMKNVERKVNDDINFLIEQYENVIYSVINNKK